MDNDHPTVDDYGRDLAISRITHDISDPRVPTCYVEFLADRVERRFLQPQRRQRRFLRRP